MYDLVIIGSGSANSLPDDRFADQKIAIVDRGVYGGAYGGTCLNVGCIPTKMFVYPADLADEARDGARLGVDSSVSGTRWTDIRDRVFGRIDAIAAAGLRYRVEDCPNITVFQQEARFIAPETDAEGDPVHRVQLADGTILQARQLVIAAGSRPFIPPLIADSGVPFHTNDDIMRLPELPGRVVIVGSGFIAAEFAHVFSGLGSAVTVIARGPRLLRAQDETIAQRFTDIVSARWDVRLNTEVVDLREIGGGGVEVDLSDGSTVTGDVLLVATGRTPNGDQLEVAAAGLTLDDNGRVPVDQYQRTPVRGIYALGDVSSHYLLKHVANHEARVVQANLLSGWDSPTTASDHRFVPGAVFTRPQVASVGLSEEQARQRGIDIAVKVQTYGDIAYGWAMEDTEGLCKLIADRSTGLLVGAHIVGYQASALIQSLITAMSFSIPVREMARGQYWIHPALPELVENALLGLEL
ncbi:mycothione reductase [Mycobacteroides franklinii]|uniref:Mycothione reductase n=1 Tax=Mycobacteroides franklinii TaxID=948102 RepID=A0A4R8QWB2_9MYCO|nr:mycothione reductase [Mycobacteroides franklinii]TDZ46686.1 Mycothione reductase [Mycobacteroides franklinii]TDZ48195.1 Mycothione reductase [Mycobacteroides franklinii]TDZ60404.1 Mycothione reductase [Mycobacteroides franklinii]TDZ65803.1 Mycothione reductase [Mycobacteroides franklinii]TDZ73972.1 Mycothione reductase [Mycobacteroides franklinii]